MSLLKINVQVNNSFNYIIFWISKKTADRRLGAAKLKLRAIRAGNTLWSSISNRCVNRKIHQQVK